MLGVAVVPRAPQRPSRSRSPAKKKPPRQPSYRPPDHLLLPAAAAADARPPALADIISTSSDDDDKDPVPPWRVKKEKSRSQSPASAASDESFLPWPCDVCGLLPWLCVCLTVSRTREEERRAYQMASRKDGIWARAERNDREASELAARDESPEQVREEDMWACPRCKSLNSRHELLCQVKVDEPVSGTECVGMELLCRAFQTASMSSRVCSGKSRTRKSRTRPQLNDLRIDLSSLVVPTQLRALETGMQRTTGIGSSVAGRRLVLWSLPQPQLQEQDLLQLVAVRKQPMDLPRVRALQLPKARVLPQNQVWCTSPLEFPSESTSA